MTNLNLHTWNDFYIRFSLIFIIILGFSLRIWGIDFYGTHPDEYMYLGRALNMLATRDLNPHFFGNPPFLEYIYMVLMIFYFILLKLIGVISTPQDFKNLFFENWEYFFFIVRYFNALIGILTAALLYFIGKRLFNEVVGLAACALLSTCFLHVRDSHFAVNDIPATFFMIVAFLFCVNIFLRAELSDYIWGGLFIGIATATKYNVGIIIFPFILAHFINTKEKLIKRLIIGLCFVAIGFLISCPWIVLSPREFFEGFIWQAQHGAQTHFGGSTENPYFLYGKTLLWGYGFLPVFFLIPGIIFLFNQKAKLWLVLTFPLIYYLSMGQSKAFFARYAIPGIPFLCLISAVGIFAAAHYISSVRQNKIMFALLLVAVFQGILFSILHNRIITANDTRVLAREWIIDHIPPQSSIIITKLYSPDLKNYRNGRPGGPDVEKFIAHYKVINDYKLKYLGYLPPKNYDTLINEKWQYMVVSDFIKKRLYVNPKQYKEGIKFYDVLEKNAKKLVTIRPSKRKLPFSLDEIYSPFWNIFLLDRPGPTLSIYQLQ